MKRILAAMLALILVLGVCPMNLFSITASASTLASGNDGVLKWVLDDEGTLTISPVSGNAYMPDYSSTSMPWYTSRDSIKSVVIQDGVVSVGTWAFFKCKNLTNVTFSNSISEIGNYAFNSCSALDSIVIPNSVTSIGQVAFSSCTALTSITISDSVAKISGDAFSNTAYYNNSNNWENGILYLDNYLIEAKTNISGECVVKDGVKRIADSAFYNCKHITSLVIHMNG